MDKAKLFRRGKYQFVQLPKNYSIDANELYIKRIDDAIMLIPIKRGWQPLIDSLNKFSEDFMNDREQPELKFNNNIFF